ncbi:MAG: hypothetical protein M0R17_04445 [Candidatus Omnitrophica bacterium]|jgi:hypothetical protein|nr:hypothetical protein [Candidatus Omnitrophota bacterium]
MRKYILLKILARLLTRKVLLKRKLDRNPNDKDILDKISKIDSILKRIENLKQD